MMQSIEKSQGCELSVGRQTGLFIKRKVSSLMPAYYVSWIIGFVFVHIARHSSLYQIIDSAMKTGSELVFISMGGVGEDFFQGVVWYVSSMLICMIILYPLLVKHKDTMLHIVLPLLIVVLLGYLYQTGTLRTPRKWHDIAFRGTIRAFAEISLGALTYYFTAWLKKLDLTKFGKLCLSAVKTVVFLLIIFFMCWSKGSKWDFAFLFLFALCIGLVFSGQGIDSNLFNNGVSHWLGKFSLSCYLSHSFYSTDLAAVLPDSFTRNQLLASYVAVSLVTALIVMGISDLLSKNSSRIFSGLKKLFVK